MTTHVTTTADGAHPMAAGQGGQHGEIQAYGTVRLTPLALSHDARLESCQILNQLLADTLCLYSLYKKCHWTMHAPTFYPLHLLLDKHAEEQLALVDALAERVQTLGVVALADPRQVAQVTTIDRPPDGIEPVATMLARLLTAHEMLLEGTRAAVATTARTGDDGSNDLLVSGVLRTHETQVWFLGAHLIHDAG